ncbi:hypothetical protein [Maritimibacter fusiformis]|uniref:Uncharacterized protein n=1 Tax=Maritimibacter fusiformis TaxID=2603819 RepID=A0A5D0RKN7_9RHOB|nr:hypothetical protein [Maritimibacter fusiformis]TYB82190.1 hypothetical protein FVF75_05535 [Maritimibacter fusiformis]
MSVFKPIIAAAALWGALPGAAQAASQNATGRPNGAWTDWSTGSGVSISWSFQGIGAVIAFHPDRIVYGGGIAPLSPGQVNRYAPTLDNLRAAATARRAVTIYWDDATNTVGTIIVRWNQPC